jgi:mannonate dehydratase
VGRAEEQWAVAGEAEVQALSDAILQGLHGQKEYTLEEVGRAFLIGRQVRRELAEWDGLGPEDLRAALHAFVRALLAAVEGTDMHIALHPDDPPWGLLGLPAVASSLPDYQELFQALPAPSNGMTFCMGSLASSPDNDVLAMAEALKARVKFVHLRNVSRLEGGGLVGALVCRPPHPGGVRPPGGGGGPGGGRQGPRGGAAGAGGRGQRTQAPPHEVQGPLHCTLDEGWYNQILQTVR